jgi:UDP-N-acetyl-L-fucosamine synthase
MEETAVMMVGLKKERILQALETIVLQEKQDIHFVSDYMKNNVSEKVIRLIISYTDYVNKKIWGK